MAAPPKVTHEEIMQRWGFQGLRVASWEASSYTLNTGAPRQLISPHALRARATAAPAVYRYVIPASPKVPEATDDEASEPEQDSTVDVLDSILAGGDAGPAPVIPELEGILKNIAPPPPPPAPSSPVSSQAEPKPRKKVKSSLWSSSWSKPSSKPKPKSKPPPSVTSEPVKEASTAPADVTVIDVAPVTVEAPLAAEPAKIDASNMDDLLASLTTAAVVPVEAPAESPVDEKIDIEPIQVDVVPEPSDTGPADIVIDVLEEPEAAVEAQEVVSVDVVPSMDDALLDDLLASAVATSDGPPLPADPQQTDNAKPTAEAEPVVSTATPGSIDDLLKDILSSPLDAALPTPPPPLDIDLAAQSEDTTAVEASPTISDSASIMTSTTEDKHVSFAPGTPEPKPTKRKKRSKDSKVKRRSSITKLDALAKDEDTTPAEEQVPAAADTVEVPVTENKVPEAIAEPHDDKDIVVVDVKAEQPAAKDAATASSAKKHAMTRPRSSSKSAGLFAAGAILGLGMKSKSSAKDKKDKKKAKDKSDSSEQKAAEPAVGLGIETVPETSEEALEDTSEHADDVVAPVQEDAVTTAPEIDAPQNVAPVDDILASILAGDGAVSTPEDSALVTEADAAVVELLAGGDTVEQPLDITESAEEVLAPLEAVETAEMVEGVPLVEPAVESESVAEPSESADVKEVITAVDEGDEVTHDTVSAVDSTAEPGVDALQPADEDKTTISDNTQVVAETAPEDVASNSLEQAAATIEPDSAGEVTQIEALSEDRSFSETEGGDPTIQAEESTPSPEVTAGPATEVDVPSPVDSATALEDAIVAVEDKPAIVKESVADSNAAQEPVITDISDDVLPEEVLDVVQPNDTTEEPPASSEQSDEQTSLDIDAILAGAFSGTIIEPEHVAASGDTLVQESIVEDHDAVVPPDTERPGHDDLQDPADFDVAVPVEVAKSTIESQPPDTVIQEEASTLLPADAIQFTDPELQVQNDVVDSVVEDAVTASAEPVSEPIATETSVIAEPEMVAVPPVEQPSAAIADLQPTVEEAVATPDEPASIEAVIQEITPDDVRAAIVDESPQEPAVLQPVAIATEIIVPAAIAAEIASPSSPTESRSERKRRSDRAERPRSSRKHTSDVEYRDRYADDRSLRSYKEHRSTQEDIDRGRRRGARKAEEVRASTKTDRRPDEDEERRLRREARRALRKAEEAEEAARKAREEAARQDEDARRRRRERKAEQALIVKKPSTRADVGRSKGESSTRAEKPSRRERDEDRPEKRSHRVDDGDTRRDDRPHRTRRTSERTEKRPVVDVKPQGLLGLFRR